MPTFFNGWAMPTIALGALRRSPPEIPDPRWGDLTGEGFPIKCLGLGGSGGTVNITEGGNALRNHPISGLSVVIVRDAIADKR